MKKFLPVIGVLTFFLFFTSCQQDKSDPSGSDFLDIYDFVETKDFNRIPIPEKITYCGEQEECLWAGQDIDAGKVIVGNDDNNLYVTVISDEGFQSGTEQVKIAVVTSLPSSRPPAGQFPYKVDVAENETQVTVQIPLSDLVEPGDQCTNNQFYILVHADVIADGNGETAWGGCDDGAGNAWWYFIDYTTQCCQCWCSFGNDYQNPDEKCCLNMWFEGTMFTFWSNKYSFAAMKDQEYKLSLIVNALECVPQDTDGNITDAAATKVGEAFIKAYEGDDGKPYVDIRYVLDEKYAASSIQLDLYIGVDRVPPHDLENKVIITGEKHMIYQHEMAAGGTTFEFKGLPWLSNDENDETFISLHAAIGDCPMPSLQNPVY